MGIGEMIAGGIIMIILIAMGCGATFGIMEFRKQEARCKRIRVFLKHKLSEADYNYYMRNEYHQQCNKFILSIAKLKEKLSKEDFEYYLLLKGTIKFEDWVRNQK